LLLRLPGGSSISVLSSTVDIATSNDNGRGDISKPLDKRHGDR
jgi:hypothetical protein